jgi:hypothetical protein
MESKFTLVPDERRPEDYYSQETPAWVTEREQAVAACSHQWELVLEDCNTVELQCTLCPAGVDDLYPDGHEMMCFGSDDGLIEVELGRHNLPDEATPVTIPVTAVVISNRTWYGDYDVEMIIKPRAEVP